MQLFWTAGPVTGLGLIGGYYIGYGKIPPFELLIYFISFTVFSGLIGLIAKVVYDGTRGHVQDQGERDIRTVTDRLGELILEIRDLQVESYTGQARKREAALQLLRRIDLSSYGVYIAFRDLTGDGKTGRIMAAMHAYRRSGVHARVRELYEDYRSYVEEVTQQLQEKSPEAARELEQRFTGTAGGNLKTGVERESFFLQRIMSAIENNNPLLMTFRDVEEMLILAFELINEREIPTLVFSYSGKWKFARTLDQLEKKRSAYRVVQARGGNRMRALEAYLRETGFPAEDELPKGLTMPQLIEQINKLAERLADEIENLAAGSLTTDDRIRLKELTIIMENVLDLYTMAHKGFRETGKRHAQLIEAAREWEKMAQGARKNPAIFKVGPGRRGLRIREDIITLDEEARLEVARHLHWYFEREGISGKGMTWLSVRNGHDYEIRTEAARRLAVELALALEPHIGLSRPEIQRNINATKAIYLGELSSEMSAMQKMELGKNMAREVDNSLGNAAEQLAEAMVRLYQVDLNAEAREFLHYTYGARIEMLNLLDATQQKYQYQVSFIAERPPVVHEPPARWQKASATGRKKLSRNGTERIRLSGR